MTLYNMSFGLVYVLTCLVILTTQDDSREEKRILASDPNYVHSLELSVQDLKQKYETSNTHLTSLLTQLASDLNDSRSTISSLTSELQVTKSSLTSELQATKSELNDSKISILSLTSELQATRSSLTSELQATKSSLTSQLQATKSSLTSQLQATKTELHDSKLSILSLTSELKTMKIKETGHGVTYVRWGRDTCPGNSTELVYTGYVGGSWYDHYGAAANYLCLPSDPQWYSNATAIGNARVYGAEYQETFGGSINRDDDVPCCVCRPAQRSSVLIIPGRTSCYSGWHTEYQGYLASGWYNAKAATEYVCLDKNPGAVFRGGEDKNGAVFFEVVAECGSLPCPPYSQGRTMSCVVCSK